MLHVFKSAATCEFVLICKVVTQFCCCFAYLIQNIALYCPADFQSSQVLAAKCFDDTNILKHCVRFSYHLS